jgi:hypothetical protein
MNVIAFSLFGNSDIYSCGAVQNALLVKKILPEWQAIFFVDELVSISVLDTLGSLGAEVVQMGESSGSSGAFWRFLAVEREGVERIIFRDTDSRISQREKVLLDEWTTSGKQLHIIRDHPFHAVLMLAGMWGVQGDVGINKVRVALETYKVESRDTYGEDQIFLEKEIYPIFTSKMMVHDAFFDFEPESCRPPRRDNGEFIGERINCQEEPEFSNRAALIRVEKNPLMLLVARLRANQNRLGRRRTKLMSKISRNSSPN